MVITPTRRPLGSLSVDDVSPPTCHVTLTTQPSDPSLKCQYLYRSKCASVQLIKTNDKNMNALQLTLDTQSVYENNEQANKLLVHNNNTNIAHVVQRRRQKVCYLFHLVSQQHCRHVEDHSPVPYYCYSLY
jgi:hypothetical protein